MRKVICLGVSLLLLLLNVSLVLAQTRSISGTVTNSDGTPLHGVTIGVKGTSIATSTNASGNFTLNVPVSSSIIIASFVGMKSVEVAVKPNLVIVLYDDATSLEEAVVTAEFGMKRISRAVGSSVQNVKGADIIESGRDNFISALQGRVSGLNVISTNGAPGASTTVILRNVTSISGNNQPLYVVDGVPMNNSTYDPMALKRGSSETFSVRNLDFSSRGNDFNPEDIESITVLKGAAAAALYGSNASNGAIIITTRKGRPGKGRVSYSNSFRWDKAYGFPDMQTKYANGAYGTTNYYYTNKFGGLYPSDMPLYDNLRAITQTGFSNRHNISVEAGSDKATLRASASLVDQNGVIKNTGATRINLGLTGQAKINEWLKFEGSMQYVNATNDKTTRGTDGPLYRAMLWPTVDNIAKYLADDGVHMKRPDYYLDVDLLNPLFALNKNKNFDKSNRFLTNVATTITPIKNTFLRAQMGWDVGMQTFESSIHPYYFSNNNGVGEYYLTHSNFLDKSLNILAGYNNKFFEDKFTLSAQVGYHQLENGVIQLVTSGTKFIIPDFQSINNSEPATVISSQKNTKRRIQAVSGQFEFGYKNLAFLTLRGRNDWSSTLPQDNNSYFYPAVEGAFILTELKALKSIKNLDYLKLRGSIAQVGKDAGPLEIMPQLMTTGITGGGFKYDFSGPNLKLRPEMTTAKEIGFETRLFNSRINADFTYFYTHCADQIVKGFRLSYATGFVLNTMNVGTFNTWGWEGHIDGDIIRKKDGLMWNVGVNISHSGSKVVFLPANVSEYYNAYTWNSGNIRNGIMVGNPITTLTGLAYQRNNDGQILIEPTTGLPLVNSKWSVIGDREPKLRYGITSVLSYKGIRLSTMLAGRYKATVVNGTKRSMMTSGNSWESVNLRESPPTIFDGVLRDGNENTANPTKNIIAVDYSIYGASIFGGYDEDWLEKNVNYLRMQELRLSYRLPASLIKKSKLFSTVDIYCVGNDLFIWSNYSGIDAVGNTVSAAAGGTGGEGYDVWSLPSPRGFTVGLSITF